MSHANTNSLPAPRTHPSGQHRRDAVTRIGRRAWTSSNANDRATAASADSLTYESRLRRPERRRSALRPADAVRDPLPLRAFPLLSLKMIEAAGLTPDTCDFDACGGDSRLVDALVAKGLKCLAVGHFCASSHRIVRPSTGCPRLVIMSTRCDQRRVFRYPACATPSLTVVADRESATRGRSMLKMQPWSGRLRA